MLAVESLKIEFLRFTPSHRNSYQIFLYIGFKKVSFRIMSKLFTFLFFSNYWIATGIASILLKDPSLPNGNFTVMTCVLPTKHVLSMILQYSSFLKYLTIWPARERPGCHELWERETLWSSLGADNKDILSREWGVLWEPRTLEDFTLWVLSASPSTLNNYIQIKPSQKA